VPAGIAIFGDALTHPLPYHEISTNTYLILTIAALQPVSAALLPFLQSQVSASGLLALHSKEQQ
jgi:hypothetical protein